MSWAKPFAADGVVFQKAGDCGKAPVGMVCVTIGGAGGSNVRTGVATHAYVNGAGPFHFRKNAAQYQKAVRMALLFQSHEPLSLLEWLRALNHDELLTVDSVADVCTFMQTQFDAAPWATQAMLVAGLFGASYNYDSKQMTLNAPGAHTGLIQNAVSHGAIISRILRRGDIDEHQPYLIWIASRQKHEMLCPRLSCMVSAEVVSISKHGSGLVTAKLSPPQNHTRCCKVTQSAPMNLVELAKGAATVTQYSRRMEPIEVLVKLAATRTVLITRLFSPAGSAVIMRDTAGEAFGHALRAFLVGANGVVWQIRDVLTTRGIYSQSLPATVTTLRTATNAGSFLARLFELSAPRGAGDRQGAVAQAASASRNARVPKQCLPSAPWWTDAMAPASPKEFACPMTNPADRMLATTCCAVAGDTPATVTVRAATSAFGSKAGVDQCAMVLPPCLLAALKDPSGYWKRWQLALNARDISTALHYSA
jgi:hypothetical protein